jgi:hypothetical protein
MITYGRNQRRRSVCILARKSLATTIDLTELKRKTTLVPHLRIKSNAQEIEDRPIYRPILVQNKKNSSSLIMPELPRKMSKKINNTKKTHYISIMVSDLWSICTCIPYFSSNYFFLLFQFNLLFDVNSIILIQIVSSIFYNSNHSFNFLIYFSFYQDYRSILINFFKKCSKAKKT